MLARKAGVLLEKGNRNLVSDVGCGTLFLESAFLAGRMNVEINLKYIKDKKFVDALVKQLDGMEKEIKNASTDVTRFMKKALA